MVSPLPKEIAVTPVTEVQDSCNCVCCPTFMRRGLASPSAPSPSMKIWKTRHAVQRSDVIVATHKAHGVAKETFPSKSHSMPEKVISHSV